MTDQKDSGNEQNADSTGVPAPKAAAKTETGTGTGAKKTVKKATKKTAKKTATKTPQKSADPASGGHTTRRSETATATATTTASGSNASPNPAPDDAASTPDRSHRPAAAEDSAPETIELVEAEVIEPLAEKTPPMLETVDEPAQKTTGNTGDTSVNNPSGMDGAGPDLAAAPAGRFVTPGVILIGLFALGLVGVLLGNATAPQGRPSSATEGAEVSARDERIDAVSSTLQISPEADAETAVVAPSTSPADRVPNTSTRNQSPTGQLAEKSQLPEEQNLTDSGQQIDPGADPGAAQKSDTARQIGGGQPVQSQDSRRATGEAKPGALAPEKNAALDQGGAAIATKTPTIRADGTDKADIKTTDPNTAHSNTTTAIVSQSITGEDRLETNNAVSEVNDTGDSIAPGAGGFTREVNEPAAEIAAPPALLSNIQPPAPVTASQIADIKADVEAEIEALKVQLEEQEKKSDEQIARLETRLTTTKSDQVQKATRQAAVSIALNNLQRQMAAGRNFDQQLDVLGKLVPDNIHIERLDAYAKTGLPTDTTLISEFEQASIKALAEANREHAKGLWARFVANLSGLFSVRKLGDIAGDTPSAIISRADMRLGEGDIVAAITEVESLDGRAATAMTGWIELARSRMLAENLIDDVSNSVLSDL